ncbi:uncharacterized protein BYT42DRAFT_115918 [Radiomyces spectabilis]|uniref:uncharacterized protein n=1 Tax=Radiomyces spectabilis TaxID=64574 RepID=UPI002220B230|nr:uncharacterized protein BYT42DRAFT_115918 [Radiomyces spectabilis]KAI8369599.1 hypothetical protein BYT42DRAFT_115918 [Radiomyces spectabilis]
MQRTLGRQERKSKNRNVYYSKRCPTCVAARRYEDQEPHSDRRSHQCPDHRVSPKERLNMLLGRDRTIFVKKIGLASFLSLEEPAKQRLQDQINILVNYWRAAAIKSQAFAAYYILDLLDAHRELPLIIFSQDFFYACIQLVHGDTITSSNSKLPRESMIRCYQEYTEHCRASLLTNVPAHKHALAYLAEQSATILVNSITENFEHRTIHFFCLKLQNAAQDLTKKNAETTACYIYDSMNDPTSPPEWPSSIDRSDLFNSAMDDLRQLFANVPKPINSRPTVPMLYERKLPTGGREC